MVAWWADIWLRSTLSLGLLWEADGVMAGDGRARYGSCAMNGLIGGLGNGLAGGLMHFFIFYRLTEITEAGKATTVNPN
jgi:hypothetical protein